MLISAGIGEPDDLARAEEASGGLGAFIRSLVGLDREAATDALSGFLEGRTLTAAQHDFIALIVEHLTANGAVHECGCGRAESLFAEADVEALVEAIRAVGASVKPRESAA